MAKAVLEGTHLDGANLTEADLTGARDLTKEQVQVATIYKTKLPEYLKT